MATGSSIELRRRLVEHLHRRGFLTDSRVASAFLTVPREVFLPEHAVRLGTPAIYRDEAIVVRRDPVSGSPQSSSSQPAVMALMLEMLDLRPGHRVLEIGAGTGYNAALLDLLTRPDGLVVTVDIDRATAAGAAAALGRVGARAHVLVADGTAGLPTAAPGLFERIEVTASSDEVPRAWYDLLVPGGCLVMPLRLADAPGSAHAITAFRRTPQGFDSIMVTCGGFMPLRRPGRQPDDPAPGPEPGEEPEQEPESEPEKGQGPAGPEAQAPARAPQPPVLSGLGPPFDLDRETVSHLRIGVRYSADPRQPRWELKRADHWITVDLPEL